MIKVDACNYFENRKELQLFNEYLKQNRQKSFYDYVQEKFNATYEADQWNSPGHFVFETNRDAILFILKSSCC
jgi:hypothetical protein